MSLRTECTIHGPAFMDKFGCLLCLIKTLRESHARLLAAAKPVLLAAGDDYPRFITEGIGRLGCYLNCAELDALREAIAAASKVTP